MDDRGRELRQVNGEMQMAGRTERTVRRRPAAARRRHVAGRMLVRLSLALVLMAGTGLTIAAAARSHDVMKGWVASADELLVAVGLGLDTVTVSGQRFTGDSDIFDCLDLVRVRTLVALESLRAKSCVEALPWVSHVVLTRVYPGRLDIVVVERTPFAVWRHNGRTVLVDAFGHKLSAIAPEDRPGLLRIAGDGAPEAAKALVETLKHVPEIGSRLELATRIEGRRWSLSLTGNIRIELPAEGEATALADLIRHPGGMGLLAGADSVVDLRSRFEIATRPAPPRQRSDGGG